MLFSSSVFIFLFLPIVLLVYYGILRKCRIAQNIFLLIASLYFYAFGEQTFVYVMMGSILANYIFGLLVDRYREFKVKSRIVLLATVAFNLGLLFVFKYLMFTLNTANKLLDLSLPVPTIVLPIGISFFTFQAMSYVIDVYRKNGQVQKNPLNVALYIAFFPQLIAGPIVRYETVADQIQNRKESFDKICEGSYLFVIGLAKKVLLANTMAVIADKAFETNASGEPMSVAFAWLGALAYTFQIFFDFSGYSDMAVGLGKMFGFEFLPNFNYPYISSSITEFWRRWHISLGTWFRDYVYFPLGGSRVDSKARLVFNLFVVWLLTGIWHGANWTFLLWGLLYFVLLSIEKLTGFAKKIGVFGHVYTLLFVILGWVLFRADDVADALRYMAKMFGVGASGIFDGLFSLYFTNNVWFFVAAALCSVPLAKWIGKKCGKNATFQIVCAVGTVLLFMTSIAYIIKGTYNPFIYFNF